MVSVRPVKLDINGEERTLTLEPRVTLLDALREHLHLTGTKKGCDQGQCGACTVHVDGQRVLACLTLAVQTEGCAITTIEGLAGTGRHATPCPAGLHGRGRLSMRVLHAGADHVGGCVHSRGAYRL